MLLNVLVTGGVQGIGRAIVDQLQARGDSLFVFDIVDTSNERVQKLQKQGVWYKKVDISFVESIKNGFAELNKTLETARLDVLVNNAGITRDAIALRLKEEDWDSVLDINLKGAFFCAQHALKKMIRQNKSYIINISSIVGIHGNPGQVNYAASKAGIIAMTKTLALEYAKRNVIVNAIAPGFITTAMTDKIPEKNKKQALEHIALGRFGKPVDIANLVEFLTSGNADYITGQVIEVTGGFR